ncbi:hypothetical protein WJX73_005469 [Symbiochloris irregularis]|uniref:Uncharacterized protein n=1 Tax=Symbiochloris irregularis TaxID=706552 RepID=A0AAW1P2H6_9CHLO
MRTTPAQDVAAPVAEPVKPVVRTRARRYGGQTTASVTAQRRLDDNHRQAGLQNEVVLSPAARWALARMTRDTPGRETHIHLTGHASCIAEGFSVPWFFATLDTCNIDYTLDVELTGFPLGLVLDGVQSFKHLKNLRLLDLTGCDLMSVRGRVTQLLMQNGSRPLQGLTTLQQLSLSGFAPFSGGWHGFQDGLCALGVTSLAKLASLDLSHNRLEDVPEHLSLLSALTRLDLSHNLLMPDSLADPAILALSKLRFLSLANCMPTCLMSAVRASTYQHEFYFGDLRRQREPAARRQAALASIYQLPNMQRLKRACPRLKQLHVCNAA